MDFIMDTRFKLLREFTIDIMKLALMVNGYNFDDFFDVREDWVPDTFEYTFGQAVFYYRESHRERFEEILHSYHDLIFRDETTLLGYIKFGIQKITRGDSLLMDLLRIMAFYADLIIYCQIFDNCKTYVALVTNYLTEIYNYAGIKEVLQTSGSYGFLRRVGEEIIGERSNEERFVDRIARYHASILERYPDRRRVTFSQWEKLLNLNPPSETGRLASVLRKLVKVTADKCGQIGSIEGGNNSKDNIGASNFDFSEPSTAGTFRRNSTSSDEESSSLSEIQKPQSILKSPYKNKGTKRTANDENSLEERKRTKIICTDESSEKADCLLEEEDLNSVTQEILIPISDPISDELRVSLDKILEEILNNNKAMKEKVFFDVNSEENCSEMPGFSKLDETEDNVNKFNIIEVNKNKFKRGDVIKTRGTRASEACKYVACYMTIYGYSDDAEDKTDLSKDNTPEIVESEKDDSKKDDHEKTDSEKDLVEEEMDKEEKAEEEVDEEEVDEEVDEEEVNEEEVNEEEVNEEEVNEEEVNEEEIDEEEMGEEECEDESSDNTDNTKYYLSSHSSDEEFRTDSDSSKASKENTDSNSSEDSDTSKTDKKKLKNYKESGTEEITKPEISDTNSENESESEETKNELDDSENFETNSNKSDNSLNNEARDDSRCARHIMYVKPDVSENVNVESIEIDSNDRIKSSSRTQTSIDEVEDSLEMENVYEKKENKGKSKAIWVSHFSSVRRRFIKRYSKLFPDSDSVCNPYAFKKSQSRSKKTKNDSDNSNMHSENSENVIEPVSSLKLATTTDLICQAEISKEAKADSCEMNKDPITIKKSFDCAELDDNLHDPSPKIVTGSDCVSKSDSCKDIETEHIKKNLDSGDSNVLSANSENDTSKLDDSSNTVTSSESTRNSDAS